MFQGRHSRSNQNWVTPSPSNPNHSAFWRRQQTSNTPASSQPQMSLQPSVNTNPRRTSFHRNQRPSNSTLSHSSMHQMRHQPSRVSFSNPPTPTYTPQQRQPTMEESPRYTPYGEPRNPTSQPTREQAPRMVTPWNHAPSSSATTQPLNSQSTNRRSLRYGHQSFELPLYSATPSLVNNTSSTNGHQPHTCSHGPHRIR